MKRKANPASKRPRWLAPVLCGVLCAALTAAAVWYDLTFNSGKLVYPMNSYAFQATDIPMLLALVLDILYLMFLLGWAITGQKRRIRETGRTRRLSPKFGLLGFLGFLGFGGFWSYGAWGDMSMFVFFVFLGFFGFFFEGKMSNTLMDERYKENVANAERKAYRAGYTIVFLLLILAGQSGRLKSELVAPILIIGIALAVALTMFLSEYLLYRYDHDDAAALEEGE